MLETNGLDVGLPMQSSEGLIATIERFFEPAREVLVPFLSDPLVAGVWGLIVLVSVGILRWDLRTNNQVLGSMMKGVWTLCVFYSGPFGLAIYWYSGRTQIPNDSVWRRGFRSTSHCYSGCGAGEIVGITLAQGILALTIGWVAAITFGFAYLFGYALTIGPLMQDGVGFKEATWDALLSETPSITVMEVFAIGTELLLASQTHMGEILFWTALAFSLSIGFLVAWPVNVLLVKYGVKEGMSNPAEMGDNSPNAA
ncbi:DUF4396 domain-containing protein [Halogeometricum sp. S1BR25-6]|uniref:DUF4396 domain-containing protein n=1 Tax=Halogeometricum salsisoli TaxID=2950536 RepID=A0ABU2GJS6_9EURY|nr:DUF4396 domain-containing protein [Halogeometricum sp. S1BR25-6]MDS0301066.1 DUF4396 domain-containing protein [Halogeometricum sp. S1BR25-6]